MSRLQNLVQTAVLKTNPVFPFCWLNKLPYQLALACFRHLCQTFPEIRGVYLRHGMTRGGWVPGISDIDLTVTFTGSPSPEDEFLFLSKFSARVAACRRIFPMIVDVDIVDEDHLRAWTQFGIKGSETPRWKVLSGATPPCAYRGADARKDTFDEAIYRFFDILLPWYSDPVSYLNLRRMQRVASRIFCFAPADLREKANLRPTEDRELLIARVLLGLDRWILEIAPSATRSTGEEQVEDSILTWEGICLLVPGSQPDEESIRRSLLRARERTPGMQIRVVTQRVLRYWFRVWQPRQYHDWVAYAQLVSGPNALSRVEPPGPEAYERCLQNMTSQILDFPQLEEVLLQSRPAWFAEEGFRWLVLRGWYVRLYWETGIHRPLHEQTMQDIHRYYPEAVKELAEVREAAAGNDCSLAALRFRAFRLLRETAVAVNRALPCDAGASLRTYAVHG